MLEHVADWRRCVANLAGVVAEGGLLVITTRSPGYPYHAFPEDYWRYTPEVMAGILEACGLEVVDCFPDDGATPGVIAKARKPAGWTLPTEEALLAPELQPERPGAKPLSILGYPHEADGSGYYRFYLPYKHLARGVPHRVMLPEPGTKFTPNQDQVGELDVIAVQRFMGGDGVMLAERWTGRVKLVYETDDDMLRPDTGAGLAHLHDEKTRETFKHCVRLSDMVTVSTEPLAEQMRQYNPNVTVLPNFVHGDMLYIDRPRRDKVTVGWSGGMSHLGDWMEVTDPLRGGVRLPTRTSTCTSSASTTRRCSNAAVPVHAVATRRVGLLPGHRLRHRPLPPGRHAVQHVQVAHQSPRVHGVGYPGHRFRPYPPTGTWWSTG